MMKISVEELHEKLEQGNLHRIYLPFNEVINIWKSQNTPDTYYWWNHQQIELKKNTRVITAHESVAFYSLFDLLKDLHEKR